MDARVRPGHDRVKMTPAPAIAPLEKTPLEVYVAPDKPSLVGASRAQLADMLGGIGVAERERKMRAQQIWHWLYVRGAQDFSPMTSISKEVRSARSPMADWRSPPAAERFGSSINLPSASPDPKRFTSSRPVCMSRWA